MLTCFVYRAPTPLHSIHSIHPTHPTHPTLPQKSNVAGELINDAYVSEIALRSCALGEWVQMGGFIKKINYQTIPKNLKVA